MKKTVNLGDKITAKDFFDYLLNKKKDKDAAKNSDTKRGARTKSPGAVDELPPNCT